ncbi:MAG: hypothetical protein IJ903_05160 [Ruminococcus sp.]|nr:hypothetical protein [Ruminococcus sp.]
MFKRETITSFSEIKLRLSGMRVTEQYEILLSGDKAEVSLYFLSYENREEKYNLRKRATVSESEMLDILNQCGVLKWNGFSGKNPPHVLDGVMFRFTAVVNDGRKISADGSNNFPKHYREFTAALFNMLNNT